MMILLNNLILWLLHLPINLERPHLPHVLKGAKIYCPELKLTIFDTEMLILLSLIHI